MRYTKKHVLEEANELYLPYINLIMRGITIKDGVKVSFNYFDSGITLHFKNDLITLFYDMERALQKRTAYNVEKYKNYVELYDVKITKKTMFIRGRK